jgi:hypothetical protein
MTNPASRLELLERTAGRVMGPRMVHVHDLSGVGEYWDPSRDPVAEDEEHLKTESGWRISTLREDSQLPLAFSNAFDADSSLSPPWATRDAWNRNVRSRCVVAWAVVRTSVAGGETVACLAEELLTESISADDLLYVVQMMNFLA